MKYTFFLLFTFLHIFFSKLNAQSANNIIPKPTKCEWKDSEFAFTSCIRIHIDENNKSLADAIAPLITKFKQAASIDLLSSKNCSNTSVMSVCFHNHITF